MTVKGGASRVTFVQLVPSRAFGLNPQAEQLPQAEALAGEDRHGFGKGNLFVLVGDDERDVARAILGRPFRQRVT